MNVAKKQIVKKELLRAAIKKRLNELVSPEEKLKKNRGSLGEHDE
jgi:hypothetical protein